MHWSLAPRPILLRSSGLHEAYVKKLFRKITTSGAIFLSIINRLMTVIIAKYDIISQ